MVTRERRSWKLDSQGHYARQIGWKTAENGKRVQHKFRLGADLTEAKRREEKLRQIWASIERCSSEPLPVWTPFALDVARRVARGEEGVVIARNEGESELTYAGRIQRLQEEIPAVRFAPSDIEAYSHGLRQWSQRNRRTIFVPWLPPDVLENQIVVSGVNLEPIFREARELHEQSTGTLH
jgi:hypothetical protein